MIENIKKYGLIIGFSLLFLIIGFLSGFRTSYYVPECPACAECVTCAPAIPCESNNTIVYVNKTIDKCNIGNDTTFIKLLQRTQRCEKQLKAYEIQNTSTICEDCLDSLHNCELTLNKTKEILE